MLKFFGLAVHPHVRSVLQVFHFMALGNSLVKQQRRRVIKLHHGTIMRTMEL